MKLLFLIIFGFYCVFISQIYALKDADATATVSTGKIKGYVIEPNPNQTNAVNVFKGIPFAEPPVGELRFALPKPIKPWEGVWNATFYKAACPSNTTATTSPQKFIHEDCLYLNIFADQACMKHKCPVLFIAHGGDFYYDSAVMFNDEYLIQNYASKGMIVVIPGYRLGLFGFIDFGSDDPVPRNLGIHDLISSLYWVQNEIDAFGGDPKRITIFGNSAGASAIAFLSTSHSVPLLWSQAFMSSPNCVMEENKMMPKTFDVLQKTGCLYSGNNTNATLPPELQVKCLRMLDWKQLIGIQRELDDEALLFNSVSPDNLLFRNKTFTQLLKNYKAVPTVIGTTTEEFHYEEEDVEHFCNKYMNAFDYTEEATVQACIDKYAGVIDENKNAPIMRDMIRAEIFRIAMQIVKHRKPVWLYSWELERHIYHAGDLPFLVGLHPVDPNNVTWKEELMLKYLPAIVHNFVANGVPDKAWPKFTSHGSNYEVLDFSNATGTLRGPHPIFQSWYPEAVSFFLGDLAAIDKAAREAHFHNKSKEAEEKWDIVLEDAREKQWEKIKNAIQRSEEKMKKWIERRRNQWEKIRMRNEKEYAEGIQKLQEDDEAEAMQQENGISKFTTIILVQSLKETEEALKARQRQLNNTGDQEGVKEIDEMLKHVEDWRDTVGDDGEKLRWRPHQKHQNHRDSESDGMSEHHQGHQDLLDRLAPEERKAAEEIWREQEEAIRRQRNANDTAQKINATIDDKLNPTHNDKYLNEKDKQKIEDAKKDINDKLNGTKNDAIQQWNDTINDVGKKVNETKEDIGKKKQEIEENKNDANKNANDKMKDAEKLRNETIDIHNDAAKDVIQKLNDTKNDISKKWNDTSEDIQNRIKDTKESIKNDVNVNEKDWIRRHNGTEKNITDNIKDAGKAIENTWNDAKDTVEDKWDDAKDTVSDGWENVKDAVEDGWHDVVSNDANDRVHHDSVNDKDWRRRHQHAEHNYKNDVEYANDNWDAKIRNDKMEIEKEMQKADEDLSKKAEEINEDLRNRKKDKNERLKNVMKDVQNAKKDNAEKRNSTQADVEKEWEDTVKDIVKEVNGTKQSVEEKIKNAVNDIGTKLNDTEKEAKENERDVMEKWDAIVEDEETKDKEEKHKKWEEFQEAREKWRKSIQDKKQKLQKDKAAKKEAERKEWESRQKAAAEEWKDSESQIHEARHRLRDANDEMDEEIKARKLAAKLAVESLRNATNQRFKERQRMQEKYWDFVNHLRNHTMKDISDLLHQSQHHRNSNKLPPNAKAYDYLQHHSQSRRRNNDWYESQLFSPLAFLAIPQFDDDEILNATSSSTSSVDETASELQQFWSAFWLLLCLATMLAFILCLNAIVSCMKSSRPTFQGYYYNEDPGFFTEKSRIVVAQYPTYS